MKKKFSTLVERLLTAEELKNEQHVNDWITMKGQATDMVDTHRQKFAESADSVKDFYVKKLKVKENKITELEKRLEKYEPKPEEEPVEESPKENPPEKPIVKVQMTEQEKAFFF